MPKLVDGCGCARRDRVLEYTPKNDKRDADMALGDEDMTTSCGGETEGADYGASDTSTPGDRNGGADDGVESSASGPDGSGVGGVPRESGPGADTGAA